MINQIKAHNEMTYNDGVEQDGAEVLEEDDVMQLIRSLQNAPKTSTNSLQCT